MRNILILAVIIFLVHFKGLGQIAIPGKPLFYNSNQKSEIPIIILPEINVKKLEREDRKYKESGNKALRFAEIVPVNIDPDKEGIWQILPDGSSVWFLRIKSINAFSLGVFFDNYRLPPGARLFVYSADKQDVKGAFTYKNNKWNNILALSPVKGDEIIIEYFEPAGVSFKGEIHISSVAHDYKNIFNYLSKDTKGFGSSGSCNVNVNCDDIDLIQRLKHSVCKITYNGWLCSGALINNTKQDGYPYFLTANHCINNSFDAAAAIFFFNYESPECLNINGPTNQSISGSKIIATPEVKTLDFSLLELTAKPPPSYQPFYSGWNRDIVNPTSVISIHHPSGDIKKITKSLTAATTGNYGENYTEFTHWWIKEWDEGTTEGGSSGAPLFNLNGELIGDLTGGNARCDYNFNDYYLQFSHAWDDFKDSTKKLGPWLDPLNLDGLNLNGYLPYDTIPSNLHSLIKDTLIFLKWNEPVDTFNIEYYFIYRNSVKYDSTFISQYTDTLVYKDSIYKYWVTALYKSPTEYETPSSNTSYIRMMDSLLLPFGEDFEGQASIPFSWYEERSVDSIGWEFKEGGFSGIVDTAFEGIVNAYFKNDSGASSKLVLPRLNLSNKEHALLSFYLNMQSLNNKVHTLNVLYKNTDSIDWKIIKTFNTFHTEWDKQNIPLPNLSNNYQIAFEGIGLGGFGICLDSILIKEDLNYIQPVFNLDKDTICLYDSIQFSTTLGSTYNIKWNFGKTASQDTVYGAGPFWIKYFSPGIKPVKLTVNNTYLRIWSDTVFVHEAPSPSFTVNKSRLSSNTRYGNQWYLNGKAIEGATDTFYVALENGNYFLEVKNSFNCLSVSSNQYIVVNSTEGGFEDDSYLKGAFLVFPNPNNGEFKVKFNFNTPGTKYHYNIIDITGKIILSGFFDDPKSEKFLSIPKPNDGIYLIQIVTSDKYYTSKFLIKK